MGKSDIEWTDYTFNPWRGCAKVSAGCKNCYAETNMAVKLHGTKWGTEKQGGTRTVASDAMWKEPVKWNAAQAIVQDTIEESRELGFSDPEPMPHRPRVFCASLADMFEDWSGPMVNNRGEIMWNHHGRGWLPHADGPHPMYGTLTMDDCRRRLFQLIDATPNLDWLLLTKRPENIRRMWPMEGMPPAVPNQYQTGNLLAKAQNHFRHNVWLGTSCENQEQADKRISELLKCRELASKLFLSCEPLLGPIDLTHRLGRNLLPSEHSLSNWPIDGIDWVITGGESGPKARPCNVEWIRSIVQQCQQAGTAVFVKQLGYGPQIRESTAEEYRSATHAEMEWPDGTQFQRNRVCLKHPKGGDPEEWPLDLRVREFPGSGLI